MISFPFLVTVISLIEVSFGVHNYQSPCPDSFIYEPFRSDPYTKWTGIVTLRVPKYTEGVRIQFILDKPAYQFGLEGTVC